MHVEVWSDVVCPWCYIGKRRLERALASFPHAAEVEVVYRSFELDPEAPTEGFEPVLDVLARKYGVGVEQARAMQDRVTAVAAEEGLEYHLDRTLRGNTVAAHRLLHLALAEGGASLQGALKEALLEAHFTRAENVADREVLRAAATGVGLDPERVDTVLDSEEYLADVRADIDQARTFGANGVPFVVVDRAYAISGAQPVEVFREALDRAWADAHPALTVVGQDVADSVCGPDGCAP